MAVLHNPRTYFAFTVDVDPDVNLPVKGQSHALSQPVEKGEARFASTAAGLDMLLKMLKDIGISATFFIEGRTGKALNDEFGFDLRRAFFYHEIGAHSFMHEDFLGNNTGVPLDRQNAREKIIKGLELLKSITRRPIEGFRAPYLRIDDALAAVLVELGFTYDSSVILPWHIGGPATAAASVPASFRPYYYFERAQSENINPMALVEAPLPKWILPDGTKLSSYLWPVLEGDLPFERYQQTLEMISAQPPSNSLAILGTHSWHHIESYKKGLLSKDEQQKNIGQLQGVLSQLMQVPGMEFVTISEYLDHWQTELLTRDISDTLGKMRATTSL